LARVKQKKIREKEREKKTVEKRKKLLDTCLEQAELAWGNGEICFMGIDINALS